MRSRARAVLRSVLGAVVSLSIVLPPLAYTIAVRRADHCRQGVCSCPHKCKPVRLPCHEMPSTAIGACHGGHDEAALRIVEPFLPTFAAGVPMPAANGLFAGGSLAWRGLPADAPAPPPPRTLSA